MSGVESSNHIRRFGDYLLSEAEKNTKLNSRVQYKRLNEVRVVDVRSTGVWVHDASESIPQLIELPAHLAFEWCSCSTRELMDGFNKGDQMDVTISPVPDKPTWIVIKIFGFRRSIDETNTIIIRGTGIVTLLENKRGYIRSDVICRDFEFDYQVLEKSSKPLCDIIKSGEICRFECSYNTQAGRYTATFVRIGSASLSIPSVLNFEIVHTYGTISADRMEEFDEDCYYPTYYNFKITTPEYGPLTISPWAISAYKSPDQVVGKIMACTLAPITPFEEKNMKLAVVGIDEFKGVQQVVMSGSHRTPKPPIDKLKCNSMNDYRNLWFPGCVMGESLRYFKGYAIVQCKTAPWDFFEECRDALQFMKERTNPVRYNRFVQENKHFVSRATTFAHGDLLSEH